MPDELALLTGPGVVDLLAAALGSADEQLVACRVREVDSRPGQGTTALYDARARGRGGERALLLGAAIGRPAGPSTRPPSWDADGAVRLRIGEREVTVWRFPFDPELPGLPAATDETAVRRLLDRCGVAPGPLELRVRSYRAGRRAVLEVRTPAARLFVKVLPPHAVEALHARHLLLRDAGLPVPRSRGRSPDGLLVLDALPGTSLRARLREQVAPDLDGAALLQLLAALPDGLCELPARRSWTDDVAHHAAVVAAALPSEAERCTQLAERVRAACAGPGLVQPVHGDLYETALLLDGDRITGLLDLDTAGPGRRADDLACVLAHLQVLAEHDPDRSAAPRALAHRWRGDFERAVDPADLRARTAGVVVCLATGPHRVQSDAWQQLTRTRLDLAEAELERR